MNDDHLKQLRYFFHYFAKLSPKLRRPKCLVVIRSENYVPVDSLKAILYYAWTKKFLDVTILNAVKKNELEEVEFIEYHYNPFINIDGRYTTEPWNLMSNSLFPDKLYGMHGYGLKMAVLHRPPYISIIRNKNASIEKVAGLNYKYTTLLSQVLNFSIEFVDESGTNNFMAFLKRHEKLLECDEVNMSTIPMFAQFLLKHFEACFIFQQRRFVALVPIFQSNHNLILPNSLLSNVTIGCIFLLLTMATVYVLKFEKKYWEGTNIMRLLLGLTAPREPRKWIKRFFFLLLSCLHL